MSQDGEDGGAKAPMANRVDAPRAPTTNARLDMAGVFAGDACLAGCGGTVGGFAEGEGVVPG
jgi:hypothetical protein